jgi:peptide/nickel transport system substrate-binding protein
MSPGKRRFFALIATTTLAATALAVPVAAQTDQTEVDSLMFGSTYAPEKGTPGGTVVISDWQAPEQMNYYYISGFKDQQVNAAAFDGLWDVSSDFKYIPDLAVSIPTISNGGVRIDAEPTAECPNRREGYEDLPGFEVDLNIRPGLKWSDGETLDLNDYKYTFDWVNDPENVGLYNGTDGWNLVDRFEVAEDGLTATVHFCTAFTGFYGLFGGGSSPLPEHYMSTIPVADAASLSYPLDARIADAPTSGPFKFASASPNTIELVRNEYWVSPWTGDPAYLDRVVFQFYADKDAMIAGLLNGEIDLATDLLQGDYAAISGLQAPMEARIKPAWEYEHLTLNQGGGDGAGLGGSPALTDPNVRMAIAHAIDKTELYETIYPGVALPEDEPCAPVAPGLYFRTTEGLTCIEYDPEKTVELLDASGWVDSDGDGIRDKDGVKLSLLHCHTGAAFRVATGDYLASELREFGIELINTPSPDTVFAGWNAVPADTPCNLTHGNFSSGEWAWVQSFNLFGSSYAVYHSSFIPSEENGGQGANYSRLNDPRMDETLDALFGATDQAEALALAADYQRIHTELQPEVVLYYRSNVRGVNSNIGNYLQNPGTASDMWNIGDWYLKDGAVA